MIYTAIDELIRYAVDSGLTPEEETLYARNLLLDLLREADYRPGRPAPRQKSTA